jgi:hypothetical protein
MTEPEPKAERQLELEAYGRDEARRIQAQLDMRGWTRGKVGFGLFVFDIEHTPSAFMQWISNCERAGMIQALVEWIGSQDGGGLVRVEDAFPPDAPYYRCSVCGRKTYGARRGQACGMVQPTGKPCPGVF